MSERRTKRGMNGFALRTRSPRRIFKECQVEVPNGNGLNRIDRNLGLERNLKLQRLQSLTEPRDRRVVILES